MKPINETITELKSLDLKTVPDEQVISLMMELREIPSMVVTLGKGRRILRGRADREFVSRKFEDEITYIKDPKIVPNYNRASLQGKSIFYGTVSDENQHYSQVLTIYEVSALMDIPKDDPNEYEEYITMGKWEVVNEVNLVAVCNHEDFHASNDKLKEFHENFKKFVVQYPEKQDDYMKLADYISREFAKKVGKDERWSYKVSAAFAHNNMRIGLDGVLYPTAQDEGKAFNVAIQPTTVDSCLKLEKVAVWRCQKKGKNILVTPFLYCDKFADNGQFIWEDPHLWTFEAEANYQLNK